MGIILNEYEWAENVISRNVLGKKPYETISRVAKYYIHKGFSKREARRYTERFILTCDPVFPLHKWSDILDNIIKDAAKRPPIIIDRIDISKTEMERVEQIGGKQAQRLAFTLLCIAKFNIAVSDKTDYWVSTPDTEVLRMANITTSLKRQCALFRQLRDEGLIQFSKKIDNLSVRVLFADDGVPAIHITDFRNLGYQYLKYHGGPYFECANCGITAKYRNNGVGRRQKYCDSCATEVKMRDRVNSVMRPRIPS